MTKTADYTPEVYLNDGQIREQMDKAETLYARAIESTGEERNRLYREVIEICIPLMNSNASKAVRQRAGTLLYDSRKAQTL